MNEGGECVRGMAFEASWSLNVTFSRKTYTNGLPFNGLKR